MEREAALILARHRQDMFRRWIVAIAALRALYAVAVCAAASAGERIVLKDGVVLEGEIAAEDDACVRLQTWKGLVEIRRDAIAERSRVADGSDRLRIMRAGPREAAPQPYVPRPAASGGGEERPGGTGSPERRSGNGVEIRVGRSGPRAGVAAGADAMRIPGSVDAPDASGPVVVRGRTAGAGEARIAGVGAAPRSAAPEAGWREDITRRMERKITIDFSDTALDDAAAFLGTATGVTVILDPKVQPAKRRLTMSVREMEAGNVLVWMTRLTDTSAILKDKAIFITLPETALKELQEEAPIEIPVRRGADIEEKITDFPGPDITGVGSVQPPRGQGRGGV
ncbi:MAG: hypothetical protein N3A38_01165 [Planctomycetota bacterium]|nr:hypothetical protein [Planctomycetota bacterium]